MYSSKSRIEVSVTAPMHNEESCAEEFVRRTVSAMRTLGCTFELIVANDGSRDNTEKILNQLHPEFPELKVISLSRNCGQWAAIYAAMQESVGEYVIVMDSDLQNPPEEIYKLLNKAKEGYALVSGVRTNRTENMMLRKIPSMIANYLLRLITTCPSRDMGGFKCIEGEMARALHLRAGQHRLLPALVWLQGGQVADVDTTSHKRFAGKSHYGMGRSLDVLFDIILFWLQNSFKARQIYLFGNLSLWTFLISFSLLVWVFVDKFAFGTTLANRPPFFLGLAGLMFAFMLLIFGFVLEMLSNVYARVSDKKPYHIKQKV